MLRQCGCRGAVPTIICRYESPRSVKGMAFRTGRMNSGIMSTVKKMPDRNIMGNDTTMSMGMAYYLD